MKLDSVEVVTKRRMRGKLQDIMNNPSQHLYAKLRQLRSTFSHRLIQPCATIACGAQTTQHQHHSSQHLLFPLIKDSTTDTVTKTVLVVIYCLRNSTFAQAHLLSCTSYVHTRTVTVYSMFIFVLIVLLFFYSNCYQIVILPILLYYCLYFWDLLLCCYLPSVLLCYPQMYPKGDQ